MKSGRFSGYVTLIAALALLLPVAARAADGPAPKKDLTVRLRQAPLREVAKFLGDETGLNFVVPEEMGDVPVTLDLPHTTAADAIAALNVAFACAGTTYGWKEVKTTEGQTGYAIDGTVPPPSAKGLADCPEAAAPTNFFAQLAYQQARLADVAEDLHNRSGAVFVYAQAIADFPVTMNLRNVRTVDALSFINHLLRSAHISLEWYAVPLPSGAWIFALMSNGVPDAPVAKVEGVVRVYYVGDLGLGFRQILESVHELIEEARLRADVNFHEGSKLLVVRGSEEAQAFVKNVVEELRKGATSAAPPST
jgi:hypothetical protein